MKFTLSTVAAIACAIGLITVSAPAAAHDGASTGIRAAGSPQTQTFTALMLQAQAITTAVLNTAAISAVAVEQSVVNGLDALTITLNNGGMFTAVFVGPTTIEVSLNGVTSQFEI